ncbi:trk system potassium uptake protein TrkH [Lentibacillus halodurans]|uniref:Trk system potassium uptake protein TrkH n=1 Tax=Lentibacillus halodurans TaxID=237679 RepID=A0A1I0Y2R9_9BACI|nr:TrkH family potassium uptake protein [Lentibacillus halodurans]SFB07621.1 trk system potassium uptake protein TrkH [Lentibacillus halodurans]
MINRKFNPAQFLVLIFITFIVIGTFLLKLPISTTEPVTILDAMFTATSALTVTGLIVVDTGTAFTLFGHIIILLLIHLGGLGIMTFAVFIFLMAGRKIGFKEHVLITQSLNQNSIGGVIILAKKILLFSLSVETVVFILLVIRWVPLLGWEEGLFASLFHAISAFNNAGFSIWSDSLSGFVGDPVVNLIITSTFILGGIGFTVIFDIWKKKKFKKFSLHTKLMVVGTVVINSMAMILVFLLEFSNPGTLDNLSLVDKIQAAFFQAVTPRTAGFNTIGTGSLNDSTLFFTILLMFIGAGSASTGGGIKLTTFLALMLSVTAFLTRRSEISVFRKTITDAAVVRSLAIAVIGFSWVVMDIFILDITEDASFITIVFETVSAFSTVGLSMGLTGDLTAIGKLMIIVTMMIGKLGPLTLAFSLATQRTAHVRYASEDILTG